MSQPTKTRILDRIRGFPAMPGGVTAILAALADPDSEVEDLEVAIRYDPGLTANLLRLANSARFGCAGGIGSIRDAIVRLGRKRLGELTLAASASSVLDEPVPGYEIPAGELWRHSVAVACAAEELNRRVAGGGNTDVFTAALLHDVGKLVMGEFVGEELSPLERAVADGESFDLAERGTLGVDHAEIGALILEHWAFPEHLVRPVRWHHRPDDCPEPERAVDIVHVADALAMTLGFNDGLEGLTYSISPGVVQRLGLSSDDLDEAAIETLAAIEEAQAAVHS